MILSLNDTAYTAELVAFEGESSRTQKVSILMLLRRFPVKSHDFLGFPDTFIVGGFLIYDIKLFLENFAINFFLKICSKITFITFLQFRNLPILASDYAATTRFTTCAYNVVVFIGFVI